MNDVTVTKRIAELHALQVEIHEHHMAIVRWSVNARNTKLHRDALLLFFKGQDLEKALMDDFTERPPMNERQIITAALHWHSANGKRLEAGAQKRREQKYSHRRASQWASLAI